MGSQLRIIAFALVFPNSKIFQISKPFRDRHRCLSNAIARSGMILHQNLKWRSPLQLLAIPRPGFTQEWRCEDFSAVWHSNYLSSFAPIRAVISRQGLMRKHNVAQEKRVLIRWERWDSCLTGYERIFSPVSLQRIRPTKHWKVVKLYLPAETFVQS